MIREPIGASGILWLPEGDCRMALQVVHGMTEHLGRYQEFAETLTAAGIAVAGFDLPGHGKNPGDPDCASLGETGWDRTLRQIGELNRALGERLPGVPQALMGFSLGSFLVRDYIRTAGDGDLSRVLILGSGDQPSLVLGLLKALVKGQIRKAGFDKTTPLVQKLSFGAYNQKFRPNRTEADWLCADSRSRYRRLPRPSAIREMKTALVGRVSRPFPSGWK